MTAETEPISEINHRWGRRLLSTGKIATSAMRLAARRVFGASGPADQEIGQALAKELDGLHAVLSRLGAHGAFADGLRAALDGPWTPLRASHIGPSTASDETADPTPETP